MLIDRFDGATNKPVGEYEFSGFRWSFYGTFDVSVNVSLAMTLGFFAICLAVVGWILRRATG